MTWLEWIGVISLVIHGSLGALVTILGLVDRLVSGTEFAKALTSYWGAQLRKKHPRILG